MIIGYLVKSFDPAIGDVTTLHSTLREAYQKCDQLRAKAIYSEVERITYSEDGPVWRNGRMIR